ncbi:hypothetical protein [Saccharopolyspora sp. 6M]|uniref:hypothetical protein n=1 Tax=Saccharopolyspora sp. 6M TaxID=2877237 RepID=UPI001CD34557|nr:hypothetical protein [Saccharopolyspora sp. 6M]MCA1226702.1 hypothetical protein [Saccharopolyspora sp. 6M]
MSIRKTITALALCAAGMSVAGAGTALAEEVVGEFPTAQACSDKLQELADHGDPGPLFCAPVTDDQNGPNNLIRD